MRSTIIAKLRAGGHRKAGDSFARDYALAFAFALVVVPIVWAFYIVALVVLPGV